MARWHAARTRIQLKLAIQRVHMLQEKREALAKRARLHISELVGRGRMETARVKTESLTLDDPDPAIREPLMAVLHAAHRTEVQELHVLQDMLCARYGAEVAQAALDNQDGCVPERITVKVAYHVPPPELVNAYVPCLLTQLLARECVTQY
ncbi:unnamed protein product [Malassezia sympodialis ATCC 42132]|uniref:uncharacterized protein n=1 Tax=Malassezia sympodialis (strain ATCC 42132) TaxID=1230383 RepID=UPI0002C243CC|nr:uncharacterized protein MSY001_0406 [Malassezia sympodialis ATCC 42132]CCU97700.1 unnamed protein product [Malassezia sympodialis ATCC 42132]|eukprot:XP_018739039.1 uncharacterized protein MSY001_0406 [Malassezia sympodialis ATCC 42132]